MLRFSLKQLLALSILMAAIVPAKAVETYIFRGAGDFSYLHERLSFSYGMNVIRNKLRKDGIHSKVYAFQNVAFALRDIRRRKPESVALLGHSMGALAAISVAATLQKEGIKVSYLGLIDIPGPVGTVPKEVAWAENFYSLFPVYGLLPKSKRHRGYISNYHVGGEIHTTMDDSRKIHEAMISAIWQIDDIDRGLRDPSTLTAFAAERAANAPVGVSTELDESGDAVRAIEGMALPGSLDPVAE